MRWLVGLDTSYPLLLLLRRDPTMVGKELTMNYIATVEELRITLQAVINTKNKKLDTMLVLCMMRWQMVG
jgi:hypothetical protein